MSLSLYPREKTPVLTGKEVELAHSWYECSSEEKKSLPMVGIKLSCPANRLVTTLSELSWLHAMK